MSNQPKQHQIKLGHGFSARFYTEHDKTAPTGLILTGPAGTNCKHRGILAGADGENMCAGGINFSNSTIAQKEGRPLWTVQSLDPLHIEPSVVCGCGDQHGFIRAGTYIPC